MTNQNQRKSFIIHLDSLSILDQLTDEQAGKIFKAIYSYQKAGEIGAVDQLITIALNPFLNQFKRDEEKWLNVVDRNRQNIAKRWNTKNTTGKSSIPDDTKNTDNDSKSKSDSKNDNESKNKKERFIKPSLEEIRNYCNEIVANINPESFLDFYESNGWKVGKNSMKDWKATVRQWNSRQKDKPASYTKSNNQDLNLSVINQFLNPNE